MEKAKESLAFATAALRTEMSAANEASLKVCRLVHVLYVCLDKFAF
jgi:hypothetical protein